MFQPVAVVFVFLYREGVSYNFASVGCLAWQQELGEKDNCSEYLVHCITLQ